MDPAHPSISIARQCELIGLPRSSYYRQPAQQEETAENLALMLLIDQEYMMHPFYGSRKMRDALRRQGNNVNRKRIQRLMRLMGIESIAPKPNSSKPQPGHKVYPYLLKGLEIKCPNQVWSTDITYIPFASGFMYLVAVMDWYSRYVLSWELSVDMETPFCVSALERALRIYGKPEIFNSDQGAQFTSRSFTNVLKDAEVLISMDGRGRALDNVFIERLWRSVKYEEIYINEYRTTNELIRGVRNYFEFYNNQRPHASLGSMAPVEVYEGCTLFGTTNRK